MNKSIDRRPWSDKFRDAFRGVRQGVAGQNSFWIHVPVGAAAILLTIALRIPRIELAIIALCVAVVLTAELFNSSLESLARRVSSERDPNVGRALEIASGAVLVASAFAMVIGFVILGPPLWERVAEWIAAK
jgi:diacylglycerol kinase (ATP)